MVSIGNSIHVREQPGMPAAFVASSRVRRPTSSLLSSRASLLRTRCENMALNGAAPFTVPVVMKPALELDQLVEAITIELAAQRREGRRDIERVRSIMAMWDASDRKTWDEFAQFDPDKAYTRNLIATDDQNFTLMLLCWNKGRVSPVHDHANSECWVRVVSGTALEELFETDPDPSKPLRMKKTCTYGPGAVTHIHDAIGIHRLGNADSESELITLHCYSPPFKSCHIFPDQLSHGVECSMTFFSEHGKKHTDDDTIKKQHESTNPCACP